MREEDLLDKLNKIERLYAGATTPGEKDAAADAIARITKRLKKAEQADPPIEYKFKLADAWSKKLFVALLRRYGLKPYRYNRQRRNTVMVRVPKSFVDETLWPEFLDLSALLDDYLAEVTDHVISEAIYANGTEEEVIMGEFFE